MNTKTGSRLEKWNMAVISTVILYTVTIQRLVLVTPIVSPIVDSILVFLTSMGVYRILINGLHALTESNSFLLRIYWGNVYLDGFWMYSYHRDNNEHRGIWRIEQDLYSTKIIGFGIDESLRRRSGIRSVTDLIEINNAYEIVVVRNDKDEPDKDFYSKTILIPDKSKKSKWYYPACPQILRGRTIIYGGKLSGTVHADIVFTRYNDVKSEEDLIQTLSKINNKS
jgi:hypothetical protein